jgi:hypothetical protein
MVSTQFQTAIDYFIANIKLSELLLDMRVQKGSNLGSDHFLTLAKLRFPPKWLHLTKHTAHKENILHYEIILLSD